MTAAPHSPLVKRVANAISQWRWDQKTDEPWERLKPTVQDAYLDQAQAALDACKAEELTDTLRLILPLAKGYAAAHPVGANARLVEKADDLLAKLDGRS